MGEIDALPVATFISQENILAVKSKKITKNGVVLLFCHIKIVYLHKG